MVVHGGDVLYIHGMRDLNSKQSIVQMLVSLVQSGDLVEVGFWLKVKSSSHSWGRGRRILENQGGGFMTWRPRPVKM